MKCPENMIGLLCGKIRSSLVKLPEDNISGTKKLKLTVEKNNSFEIRKFSQRNEYDRGMRWKRDRREIRGNLIL